MNEQAKKLLAALVLDHKKYGLAADGVRFRLVQPLEGAAAPYLIAYSPSGSRLALELDHTGFLIRRPLPPSRVVSEIESICPAVTLDQLTRELEDKPSAAISPSWIDSMVSVWYAKFLLLDPQEEVVVKDYEIFIMGFTVEEFARLCPMTFISAVSVEVKFVQRILDRVMLLASQIQRNQSNMTANQRGKANTMFMYIQHLLVHASRLPDIDVSPKRYN